MPSPEQDLIKNARLLRNANPHAFDDFLVALNQYREEQVKNLLDATTGLERAQGQAAQCTKFLRILEDSKKIT